MSSCVDLCADADKLRGHCCGERSHLTETRPWSGISTRWCGCSHERNLDLLRQQPQASAIPGRYVLPPELGHPVAERCGLYPCRYLDHEPAVGACGGLLKNLRRLRPDLFRLISVLTQGHGQRCAVVSDAFPDAGFPNVGIRPEDPLQPGDCRLHRLRSGSDDAAVPDRRQGLCDVALFEAYCEEWTCAYRLSHAAGQHIATSCGCAGSSTMEAPPRKVGERRISIQYQSYDIFLPAPRAVLRGMHTRLIRLALCREVVSRGRSGHCLPARSGT